MDSSLFEIDLMRISYIIHTDHMILFGLFYLIVALEEEGGGDGREVAGQVGGRVANLGVRVHRHVLTNLNKTR